MKLFCHNHNIHAKRGFTLVEVMVSTAVGSIVLLAMCLFSFFSTRSFLAAGNYADLDRKSRTALDIMSRDIRQASYLMNSSTNMLLFSMGTSNTLAFTWDPAARTLTRTRTGEKARVLLSDCDYLHFDTFQRNMSNQVFGAFSNATPATCKLIDLNWRCSRSILGKKVNTESVQTAKIVIRNEHPH